MKSKLMKCLISIILILVILSAFSAYYLRSVKDEKGEEYSPNIEYVFQGSNTSEWICNIREYNGEIYFIKTDYNLSRTYSINKPDVEDHIRVLKITKEDQIIELFRWGDGRREQINDFFIDDTGIYCVGSTWEEYGDSNYTKFGDGIVYKFDFHGSLLWTYIWDVEYRDSFYFIEKFGDGLIIGGNYRYSYSLEDNHELVYISQDGKIIWNTTIIIEELFNGISSILDILTTERYLYIIGSIPDPFGHTELGFLFGVDLNGKVVMAEEIIKEDYIPGGNSFFNDINIANQNTLVVGSSTGSIIERDAPEGLEYVIINYSKKGKSYSCLFYRVENSINDNNEFVISYEINERWDTDSLVVESINENGEMRWNTTHLVSNQIISRTKLLLLNEAVYILTDIIRYVSQDSVKRYWYSDIIKIEL